MKLTAISIIPPENAQHNPKVTPELLASVLARYSRSNDGLPAILGKIDLNNAEASIERILKFVDYGHASIGGLTSGIAIAIDDVSMWLAFKVFELSPMADGQESSTRYISLDERSLPNFEELGFAPELAEKTKAFYLRSLKLYQHHYKTLNDFAESNPEAIRLPENCKPAEEQRIRKNYALDRCRYFLPFGIKTNVALIQSARMWSETISALASLPQPEAQTLAAKLKVELNNYTPKLLRHARPKKGWHLRAENDLKRATKPTSDEHINIRDKTEVTITTEFSDEEIAEAINSRENRYDACDVPACATQLQVKWNNISIAELRDLNRHRTGFRYSSLAHLGLYLPPEIPISEDLALYLTTELPAFIKLQEKTPHLFPYFRLLGSQTDFSHQMQLDKFVYTAELRTGRGSHFRYVKHYHDAVNCLSKTLPLTTGNIQVGTGEPE
jgi:thymidylate synthase ThyX